VILIAWKFSPHSSEHITGPYIAWVEDKPIELPIAITRIRWGLAYGRYPSQIEKFPARVTPMSALPHLTDNTERERHVRKVPPAVIDYRHTGAPGWTAENALS
jgi:hypothetical protein